MLQQQFDGRMLLGRKIVSALQMFCFLLYMHHGDIFCFDLAVKRSHSDQIQSNGEEEDVTLMAELKRDVKVSADFLGVLRGTHSWLTSITEHSGIPEPTTKTSAGPKEQDVNDNTSQPFTNQTKTLSNMNERTQSSTEPWCCEGMTTLQTTTTGFHPEVGVGVISVTDKYPTYCIDINKCAPQKRTSDTGDNGTTILDIIQLENFSNDLCSFKFADLKGKIVSVYIRQVKRSKTSSSSYVCRHDMENCSMLESCMCPVFSEALIQKQCYSTKRLTQCSFLCDRNDTVQISIHFGLHEQSPGMMGTPTSSISGSLMSPGEERLLFIPAGTVGHNVSMFVPDGFVVMISVQHFDSLAADSMGSCLQIRRIEDNPHHRASVLTQICVADGTSIQIVNESFVVEFPLKQIVDKTKGVQLVSSVHKEDEQPARLRNGFFNCSTSLYRTFKRHIECNFITECLNGEDERDCPYTASFCRHSIYFRGKCYSYFSFLDKKSWMQASSLCRWRGSRLATFHNSSDLDAFAHLIMTKRTAFMIWIGLQVSGSRFGTIYKRILRWTNNRSSFDFITNSTTSTFPSCALLQTSVLGVQIKLNMKFCNTPTTSHVLCENMSVNQSSQAIKSVLFPVVRIESQNWSHVNAPIMICEDRHFVLDFLSCNSPCHSSSLSNSPVCETPAGGVMPLFPCDNLEQTLPYTLVCDHHSDCLDNSDESFCRFKECREFVCNNGKCIGQQLRCNRLDDCDDGSDEIECYESNISERDLLLRVPPLSVIELDGSGSFSYAAGQDNQSCPETHFKCPQSHCLPVYLHCNEVNDCSWGEDEGYCKSYDSHPGFFHCYLSKIFLHLDYLCDGVPQCPHHDDEKYCGWQCPSQCRCQGLAFVCNQSIAAKYFPDLRYLDASGTNMTLSDLQSNYYLLSLKLSGCGLTQLQSVRLQNLRELNLSNNSLNVLDPTFFMNFPNLKVLYMSWNPIGEIFKPVGPHLAITTIHLSGLMLQNFQSSKISSGFPNTRFLNISHSKTEVIDSFKNLSKLNVLDMNESPITTFPADVFAGLEHLRKVSTMNYKLCCPAVLPSSFPHDNCFAPVDDVSSCENLLRLPLFRISLWIFAVVAIIGNSVSFGVRLFFRKKSNKTGFPVFVTNLCVADLLMGVYLSIIGVADYIYLGSYLWQDEVWKNSWPCKVAGFLSLLSSEVSAFIICLITLDRFIVMRFPFSQRRFQRRSARIATGVAWLIGVVIAAVPLMPGAANWDFYGQTGICIPLPFSTYTFPGQKYSFAIMIVLNFVLFMMIAVGQVAIFCSVRSSRKSVVYLKTKPQDLTIAHRLALIVLSDFLCWFPIGLLGLLAAYDVPIPDEVNVGMAIFVLPFNSALNPFLYTFNAMMERRREKEKRKLMEFLENRIRSGIQAEKTKRQSRTCNSQPVVLLAQVLDRVHRGELSDVEADLMYSMARELVAQTKTRIHGFMSVESDTR